MRMVVVTCDRCGCTLPSERTGRYGRYVHVFAQVLGEDLTSTGRSVRSPGRPTFQHSDAWNPDLTPSHDQHLDLCDACALEALGVVVVRTVASE